MEGGSRASHSRVRRHGERSLRSAQDEDEVGMEMKLEREQFDNHGRRTSSSRVSAPTYRSMVSAMLLSLLPLPAAAYPRSEPRAMRRDRRRSGDFGKREMTSPEERPMGDSGWEKRRRRKMEKDQEVEVDRAQNSQVSVSFLEL
jgi:hypothetical protein